MLHHSGTVSASAHFLTSRFPLAAWVSTMKKPLLVKTVACSLMFLAQSHR